MTTAIHQTDAAEGGAWRGSTALALVVVFLAGTFASAAAMHGCPQHHHAPSPEALSSRPAQDDGDAAAGHGEREGPAGSTCTCLGDCQAGAPTALHEPPVRAVPEPERLDRVGPAGDEGVPPSPRAEYFLPYPLGPPRA